MNVRGTKLMANNIISSLKIWRNINAKSLHESYTKNYMDCFNKFLSTN